MYLSVRDFYVYTCMNSSIIQVTFPQSLRQTLGQTVRISNVHVRTPCFNQTVNSKWLTYAHRLLDARTTALGFPKLQVWWSSIL